jgi:hypothetical protein
MVRAMADVVNIRPPRYAHKSGGADNVRPPPAPAKNGCYAFFAGVWTRTRWRAHASLITIIFVVW